MAAAPPSGFNAKAFIQAYARIGHGTVLGLRHVADGPDWCEMALDWSPDLVADAATGILASGPIISMMDMATGLAIWIRTGIYRPHVTLDLRVDYLRPAEPGKTVFGRGECYRVTRHIAFVRGQANDGDPARPIAHVAGTFMFTGPPVGATA